MTSFDCFRCQNANTYFWIASFCLRIQDKVCVCWAIFVVKKNDSVGEFCDVFAKTFDYSHLFLVIKYVSMRIFKCTFKADAWIHWIAEYFCQKQNIVDDYKAPKLPFCGKLATQNINTIFLVICNKSKNVMDAIKLSIVRILISQINVDKNEVEYEMKWSNFFS